MYLDRLNDDMVGFTNISTREILDHLFPTYGSITTVDLQHNFENMRNAWDPHQPVDTLFKQIHDCSDYADARGVTTIQSQKINVAYAKIFATRSFMSACRRWNEKEPADKTWTNFNVHFATEHRQHKQMQGESAAKSGYHTSKADAGQHEDQMAESTIEALTKLETATATDCGVVAILTEANARLGRQLEERSKEVKEVPYQSELQLPQG
jgi:hypothetical protein